MKSYTLLEKFYEYWKSCIVYENFTWIFYKIEIMSRILKWKIKILWQFDESMMVKNNFNESRVWWLRKMID